jgi:glycerol kinase
MRPDIVPGAIFPDYELSDHTAKRRKLSELQGRETTALGAAYAAGLAVGYYKDLADLRSQWVVNSTWQPHMDEKQREALYTWWKKAVARSFDWVDAAA